MSKMIQLRHVPDDLHRLLRARAALEGLPLPEYLIRERGDSPSGPHRRNCGDGSLNGPWSSPSSVPPKRFGLSAGAGDRRRCVGPPRGPVEFSFGNCRIALTWNQSGRNRFAGREVRVIVHQRFPGLGRVPERRWLVVKPKLKVWVMFGDRVKFGQGRATLLRLIDELGSINQAVERFEMSYRNAWGYLRELERAAGFRLLERKRGGGRAAGTRLTQKGRDFLDRYDRFERDLESGMARCFDRAFPTVRSVRRGSRRNVPSDTKPRGPRNPPHKAM
jgi:molybdate transport system regulatory protein